MARVSVSISDPWDLGESLAWRLLSGELLRLVDDDRGGRALLRLDTPIVYQGMSYRYVVASPRHEGDRLIDLDVGRDVFCALTGISDQKAESSDPLDTSSWRTGLAFIGTLHPAVVDNAT